MLRRRDCSVSVTLAALILSMHGCSHDMPTSSTVDLHATPGSPTTGSGDESQLAVGAVTVLVPKAIASVRHLPEMDILEGGGLDGDAQSSYFRTTETNREFRRGFAEFAIPNFSNGFLGAKLVLRETRASIELPVPPDGHELSSYTDVDLVVTTGDFDRPTSPLATFETDANLEAQTFEFDVSSLIAQLQGATLGLRVKLEVDPTHTGFRPLGTAFNGSSTPPGVTIEVITTIPAAIDHLQEVINGMSLSPAVTASLLAPLQQAEEILTDDNPNNDKAACGKLRAFVLEIDTREANEVLSAQQAAELRQLALGIETGLGCADST